MSARPAATVVVVRDSAEGLECLLVRRSPSSRTFPGAWVFPGGGVEAGDVTADDLGTLRRAAVRETVEEAGLVLDPEAMVAWSTWHPPHGAPISASTTFFVAPDPRQRVVVDGGEIVEATWTNPLRALDSHAVGAVTLLPPTWITLVELTEFASARQVLEAAPAELPQYRTRVDRRGDRTRLSWPNRPVVLDISELPWNLVDTTAE